jgi:hypothetical protein
MDHATGKIDGAAAGASCANGAGSSGRRSNRVRSKIKRRGSRGRGGKGKAQKLSKEKEAIKPAITSDAPMMDAASPRVENKDVSMHGSQSSGNEAARQSARKKVRERKNRKWKPFSEMTWQERYVLFHQSFVCWTSPCFCVIFNDVSGAVWSKNARMIGRLRLLPD